MEKIVYCAITMVLLLSCQQPSINQVKEKATSNEVSFVKTSSTTELEKSLFLEEFQEKEKERKSAEVQIEKERKMSLLDKKNKENSVVAKNIKSLYYTTEGVSNSEKYKNFLNIAEKTEINSITIDVKTVTGYVNFPMDSKYFQSIKPTSNGSLKNIKKTIEDLHKRGIYVIGRIVVFKDELLAQKRKDLVLKWTWDREKLWNDPSGKHYIDPFSKEVWDYHIGIASAAYELGFDEINFDYVRFPSD